MKKTKTIILSLFSVFVLTVFVSCNGAFDMGQMLSGGSIDSSNFQTGSFLSDDDESLVDDESQFDNVSAFENVGGLNSADADSDSGLLDEESYDSSELGSGHWGSGPEQLPVTLSKADPDDENCNESTQGTLHVVENDSQMALLSFMIPKAYAASRTNYDDDNERMTLGDMIDHFENRGEEPDVYQCQVYIDVDGEEAYEWVPVEYENILDLYDSYFDEKEKVQTNENQPFRRNGKTLNKTESQTPKVHIKSLEEIESDSLDNQILQPRFLLRFNPKTQQKEFLVSEKDAVFKMNVVFQKNFAE